VGKLIALDGEGKMLDQARPDQTGLVTVDAATGEIMPAAPQSLDDVVKRSTGGMEKSLKTSCDLATADGKDQVAQHLGFSPPENLKVNGGWYGRQFDLVAYTCRAVLSTKNKDGTTRANGMILVRTVLETAEGELVDSSSDYLYASLMEIISFCGQPSAANPIRVYIGKGGAADKLFRVFDKKQPSQVVEGENKPSRKKS
jgi:hypothetical protein